MVTELEIQFLQAEADQWRNNLSEGLKEWCIANGFQAQGRGEVKVQAFTEAIGLLVDVAPQVGQIIGGHTIAQNSELYAIIFVYTGLAEADPRKIPPRIRNQPHSGGKFIAERRWTEEQYEQWLKQREGVQLEQSVSAVEWRERLGQALRDWCTRNGYKTRALASELSIRPGVWKHILRGENYTREIHYYARLFVRTGLAQADPRTLPFEQNSRRRIPRPWSNEDFQEWYSQEGVRYQGTSLDVAYDEVHQEEVPAEDQPGDIDPRFVQLCKEGIDYFAKRVATYVTEQTSVQQSTSTKNDLTVEQAVSFLCNLLMEAVRGTSRQRDELQRKHSEDLLKLLPLLSTLMKDRDKREVELEMMDVMEVITDGQ